MGDVQCRDWLWGDSPRAFIEILTSAKHYVKYFTWVISFNLTIPLCEADFVINIPIIEIRKLRLK